MSTKLKYIPIILLGMLYSLSFAQGTAKFINSKTQQRTQFEFHNNLIIIPLEVNGILLNFILDTGAAKTVIFTLNDSDSLVLNNTKIIELRGLGTGEPIKAVLSEKNNIKLGNILGTDQTIYMVFDEHFDFSSKVGKTIHGIIGYELLHNFIVQIDFKNETIFFKERNKFNPEKYKKYNSFSLNFHQNKPYINGNLKITDSLQFAVKMLIDTGNTDALWVFEDKNKNILSPPVFFEDHLGEGLSGSIEGKRTKISSFEIGDFKFNKPTIAFLDSTATSYARSYEERNGSVGNQILNRFKIILDYSGQHIYLKKTRSFTSEFKYNRAGIEVSYFGKTLVERENIQAELPYIKSETAQNRTIKFVIDYIYEFKPVYGIQKIRKESPADLAGLKINDILYKINGRLAHEYEIEEINAILYGDVDKNVSIYVERNGTLFYCEFRLKDLL